jgi:hypothetical protein
MRSYLFIAVLVVSVLSSPSNPALAKPSSVSAKCNISCTVAEIVEWSDSSFPAINLADLTTQSSRVSGSSSLYLYTNGDVEITADNSDAAQLSKDDNHRLVTEYKLEYDAFGLNKTSGSMVDWNGYDSFLSEGSRVTHVSGDGAVEVTLSVRVSNDSGGFGNSLTPNLMSANPYSSNAACIISCTLENVGKCTATQTLTACWQS